VQGDGVKHDMWAYSNPTDLMKDHAKEYCIYGQNQYSVFAFIIGGKRAVEASLSKSLAPNSAAGVHRNHSQQVSAR